LATSCHPAPDADAERFFRYFPRAWMSFEQLGFCFYRFTPLRFHWNGGFATARWLGIDRIVRANPLSRESQEQILAHMNQNHADALRQYLMATDGINETDGVSMLGIDAEGIDLRAMDKLRRIPLTRTIGSDAEARQVLVEMAADRN